MKMTSPDITGKVLTKRIRAADGTAVMLHYHRPEAHAMRALVQSIKLKGDRTPTMALIARRSMQFYLNRLETARQTRPDIFEAEIAVLDSMVTRVSQPAKRSRRQAHDNRTQDTAA